MKSAFILAVSLSVAAAGLPAVAVLNPCQARVIVDNPTVEEVLANSVKAVGGREALDKIKTLHIAMTMKMGQEIETDSSWSRSGGRLMTMTLPGGMGEMNSGTDGKTAWSKSPMGYTIIKDANQRKQLNFAAIHMSTLDPTTRDKDEMKGMAVVGKEKFQDKDCYKVSYTRDGKPGFVFFDVESGLPAGASGDGGRGKSMMSFSDWKKIEGVQFFHKIKIEIEGAPEAGEMAVSKIEVNGPAETAFALPDEVKKLAADKQPEGEKKPEAAAAPEIKLEDLSEAEQKEAKQLTDGIKSMDLKMLKDLQKKMEMGAQYAPENKKKVMAYCNQELKKEIANKGG